MEKVWYVFGVFGMIVAGIICLIALVWATCFAVRILVKTFTSTVENFNSVEKEHISKKYEARRDRLAQKRIKDNEHKQEILDLKLAKQEEIHKIKLQKLEEKLNQQVEETATKNNIKYDLTTKYNIETNKEQTESVDEVKSADEDETKLEKSTKNKKNEK